jgi:hypothetical protein
MVSLGNHFALQSNGLGDVSQGISAAATSQRLCYDARMREGEKQTLASALQMLATSRLAWALAPLLVGLLIPSTTLFCVEITVGQISPGAALADVLQRQFGVGHNLFLVALLGLIPFAALSTACLLAALRLPPPRLACLAVGGMAGIAWYMIPAHVAVWYPYYSKGRISSTDGIAFIFIPFFCFGPLAVGLLAGWAVSLLPRFSVAKTNPRWTYSLGALFVLMTIVAAVCGLLGFLIRSYAVAR